MKMRSSRRTHTKDHDAVRPGPDISAAHGACTLLAPYTLFSGIDPQLVGQLAAKSRTRRLAAGKWLFRERDLADEMYVVRAAGSRPLMSAPTP
jgi:hypothetical protein